jgi:hypothetical protein
MSAPKKGKIGADPTFETRVGADFGQYWFRDGSPAGSGYFSRKK